MKTTIIALLIIYTNQLSAQQTCLSGDCKNGFGKAVYADGGIYEGMWKNGLRNGKGTYTDKTFIYTGDWKEGLQEGQGENKTIDYYNEKPEVTAIHTGTFSKGELNGAGKSIEYIGRGSGQMIVTCEGNFKDGQLFGKGTQIVKSDYIDALYTSDTWDHNAHFKSGTRKFAKESKTAFGSMLNGTFANDSQSNNSSSASTSADGPDHFKSIAQRMADINAGKMERHGSPIKHAERIVNLANGQYSEIIKYGMMGYYYSGFKRYFISPTLYSKKYPIPFGARFIYQLVNSKNELLSTQDKYGNDLECYFDIPEDGDYTIQVAYDFSGCAGCQQVSGLRIQFGLYSQDFDKKQ